MSLTRPKVLLVDDDLRNLRVLEGCLAPMGYDLNRVQDGKGALAKVAADPPDIILLDVMMPLMSGFEVCTRLKSNPETQFIPIILVTALSDRASRVSGIEAGADDFITKPVDAFELRARVKSLLRIKTFHDELRQSYRDLQRLEVMRESLTQMIVHDFRNPLSIIMGHLQILQMNDFISKEASAQKSLHQINTSAQTLMDMITAMLDLAKLEAEELPLDFQNVSLKDVCANVEAGAEAFLAHGKQSIRFDIPDDLPFLRADREIFRRILANIISNAISFSPEGGHITVDARQVDGKVHIFIHDEGPGIPLEEQSRIFEKFGQVESRQAGRMLSTGLGLAFCKMAIDAHSGEIGVNSLVGQGSTFWFTLPVVA
ncbi:MAG: two-component system sensor histidine kinase/response regulator [Candidatus Latescibacterota bacterium]|jgi:two-component system sensor histidine kinase/response regulator